MDALPDEILLDIFGHLRGHELLLVRRVCSHWEYLVDESILRKRTAITDEDVGMSCSVATRIANLMALLPLLRKVDDFHLDYGDIESILTGATVDCDREKIHDLLISVVALLKQLMMEDRVPLHSAMADLIYNVDRSGYTALNGKRAKYSRFADLLTAYVYLDAAQVTFPSADDLIADSAIMDWLDSSNLEGNFRRLQMSDMSHASGRQFLFKSLAKMHRLRQVTFEMLSDDIVRRHENSSKSTKIERFLDGLQAMPFASTVAFRRVRLRYSGKLDLAPKGLSGRVEANVLWGQKNGFSLDLLSSLIQRLHAAEKTQETLTQMTESLDGLKHLVIQPLFNVEVTLSEHESRELEDATMFLRDCFNGEPYLPVAFPAYMRHLLCSGACKSAVDLNIKIDDVRMQSIAVLNEAGIFHNVRRLKVEVKNRPGSELPSTYGESNPSRLWGMLTREGNFSRAKSLEVVFTGANPVDCVCMQSPSAANRPLKCLESFQLMRMFVVSRSPYILSILDRATSLRHLEIYMGNIERTTSWKDQLPWLKSLLNAVGRRTRLKYLVIKFDSFGDRVCSESEAITASTTTKMNPDVLDALRGLDQLDSLFLELGPMSGDRSLHVEVTLRNVFPRLQTAAGLAFSAPSIW